MSYDFETIISREGTGSSKWNLMYECNPDVSEDVVPLSVADMEFQTPPEIKEGLKSYIDDVILGYTGPYPAYYDAVESWLERRHNLKIERDWLLNTPGVVNALFAGVNAFTEPGDGVLLFKPVYLPFVKAVETNDRKVVNVPLIDEEGYYSIDFDKFEEEAKKDENKLLLFCNPHNPVGRVWKKEELKRLGDICVENDIIIISDDIWSDIIMPGYEHTSLLTISEEISQITVACTAPSKTFNIAGLAVSNILVKNEEMREVYRKALEDMRSDSVNILGYKACEVAYNESEAWLDELIKVIDRNQKVVNEFFSSNYPEITAPLMEGTYVQWVDFRSLGMSADELEKFMYNEAEFFTNQGSFFGEEGNGFLRINIAVPTEVLERELSRLKLALDKIV